MKQAIVASVLIFAVIFSYAQDDKLRTEINNLEERSRHAILQKDSATLHKLWSPTFMVNSPNNNVIKGGQVDMVMAGRISYTSYKGAMEEMLVSGDMVITMGHETVVPVMGNPNGGQTIQRRYTNIWKKGKEGWMLIARQGSELCRQQ
jgi:ketosteroid isomerase-like protein